MPRPPFGILVESGGDAIRFSGRRKPVDPAGFDWHDGLSPAARNLLDGGELEDLRWNGTAVVRRGQAEIDARDRDATIATDDRIFESPRTKAMFLVLFDEINRLRTRAGLQERTIQQAKDAYRRKLNR